MALQSSGAISIDDIVAEFGGSAPDGLTEYYRGGAYVPDITANNGIPTSGAIALEDFYGATNEDKTPNAMNFNNLGPGDTTGNTVTVTGINVSITIRFTETITTGSATVYKNGSSQGTIIGTLDVSVSNNDTLRVDYADTSQSGTGTFAGTVTVNNQSDGSALLDTISVQTYGGGF